ncbi:hypothetical protein AVEN_138612-1 [Araneus ventricosus]|uniref:Uncharacterized protein n=1 Tax=Araneus ventricosus TaxID=182803 RepID=A0A4Y2Q912_ARAVE|nr:hypothetical protein AVEN_138612-1 [Araneus ventricosus]
MWAFKVLSWFGIGQKTNQSRAMDLIFVLVMLLTYFDTLFLYFLAVKINGYELKWALERILSVTCSILLMLLVNRNRHEFAAAIRKAKLITNTKSEKKLNFLVGCILASPFIYSLVLLLACEIESALTYQADTVINSINVTVPLIVMFWIPEEIQMELEKLNKIILWKYEMRASSGMISENPSIEKLLLEERPFVLSGCSLIAFQRCHILSVFGTALTYGLLILSFEVRN